MKDYPFLSHLGIDPKEQVREPSPTVFPRSLNPNNKSVWIAAVEKLKPMGSTRQDWAQCISRYVTMCADRGVYPFQNVHQARNDSISNELRQRRLELARFVDRVGLFDDVLTKKVTTEVHMTDDGFILCVDALVEVSDPSFDQWIRQAPDPRFSPAGRGQKHVRDLGQGLMVYVQAAPDKGPRSWHIGYEIVVHSFPDLPTNHMPSRAELEDFVKRVLWTPHFKAIRFKAATKHPV
ncbi:hypothetical protein H1O16_gp089 [Burkholderia phage BcepSaruman]|uniref:Uncharacterized protein n=1 Tax=Burkholderia phage BcepSaruman TaxID=2530032 RepID=A0A4D5ZG69_9CAUD|nr:hypothetical protein H1O16_gp089 [Burkholderia phage BcepSaruman]QBX06502.1 hypothetical protein BcepSaruman_089 [Burkholderia phage BcepSaruman]